jgi:hypothetical protein
VQSLREMSALIAVPVTAKASFWPVLWNDFCSEFDAQQLYERALAYRSSYSKEFCRFLDYWKADEENHTAGFRELIKTIFAKDDSWIALELEKRTIDFSKIQTFISDEFKLCVLLAYDELVTTQAYALDRARYRGFGGSRLESWISEIKKDEAFHFASLLSIIKSNHRHRLAEAAPTIEEILRIDLESTEYRGTFVLDHTGIPFTPQMLKSCANSLRTKLENLR